MNWLLYIGGIVIIAAIAVLCFIFIGNDENDIQHELYQPSTAQKGWNHLLENKDAESLFLQSRIYFNGNLPDSIVIMKKNLEGVVKSDNKKAHQLLEEAYKLDPNNTKILYNLGLDWYYGEERGVDARNLDKALQFFNDAMKNAKATNDAVLQNRIQIMLDKFE